MSNVIEVQSPDIGYVNLVLGSLDAEGNPVSITYKLTYDYRGIKRFDDATAIDLKDFTQWAKVKSGHTPELVHAGLAKFHPDVTLDQVIDQLNPSAQAVIQDAIFELLFPGLLEKIKGLKEQQDRPGEVSPNVESEATVAA
jgi:hypothetical protein